MRCFIAIPVPNYIKDYAQGIVKSVSEISPDVKWVENENYHLTLKFLGDIDPGSVKKITERLQHIAKNIPPFQLKVNGAGFFPNAKRPRVVWLGVAGELEQAMVLGEKIDTSLLELNFAPERKRSFHLTLGRIRSEYHLIKLLEKVREIDKEHGLSPFEVGEFKLMESILSPRGSRYKVLASFSLTKS
ncbi:MAG: RNA 2',3'-cyclic phosphodiesterase [Syntrophomonadaceae bacterium]|nr:RNA 2',3'-cyclic phosphodiesterase [Syntrophomonadaceae bacterium]